MLSIPIVPTDELDPEFTLPEITWDDADLLVNEDLAELADDEETKKVDHLEHPQFWLIRGEEKNVQTRNFSPGEMMTIVIRNTDSWRQTKVIMTDEDGNQRYAGTSSGSYHILSTRLGETNRFGTWLLHIEGPIKGAKQVFQANVKFYMDPQLREDLYETHIKIFENNGDVDILYRHHDFE